MGRIRRLRKTLQAARRKMRRVLQRVRRNAVNAWDARQSFSFRWHNKAYWSRLSRSRSARQRLPAALERANGTMAESDADVREEYARAYEAVQADDQSANDFDDAFKARIEAEVNRMTAARDAAWQAGREAPETLSEDTVQHVVKALERGVATGPDQIPGELFKYGGPKIISALTALFNLFIALGTVPRAFQEALLCPVYKGKGARARVGSYRPIRLLNTLAKLFAAAIRHQFFPAIRAQLSELQAAFRPKRGTIDNIFVLVNLILYRSRRRLPTFTAFVDTKKAFDQVWRPGLWHKLSAMGMPAPICRVLQCLYHRGRTRVVCPQGTSRAFEDELGVRQGCLLSPDLYIVFVNDLLVHLENSGIGIQVGDYTTPGRVPGVMYADDLVLMAESEEDLQRLLDLISEYARKWRFRFNCGRAKTEVIVFNKRFAPDSPREFYIGCDAQRQRVREVDAYKFLGVRLDENMSWRSLHEHLKSTAEKKLRWLYGSAGRFHGTAMPPRFVSKLWLAVGRPALEYASEVCGHVFPAYLEVYQRTLAKRTLGAPRNAWGPAAVGDLGWPSMRVRQEHAMLRYFGRILAMPATRLPRRVYEMLRAEGRRRTWTGVVERLAVVWGYADVWDSQRLPRSDADDDADAWREQLKRRAKRKALEDLRSVIAANPSTIGTNYAAWYHVRANDTQMRMADYIRNAGADDPSVATMFALRSGTSNLRVDRDRRGLDRAHRLCRQCTPHWPATPGRPRIRRAVEDARHALVDCPAHAGARQSLLDKLPPALRDLRAAHVFNALMGSADLAVACGRDGALRRNAVEAVKAFWARAERRRSWTEPLAAGPGWT